MLLQFLVFAHVLSAFLYLLAHGGSVAVAFRLRTETNAERVRALLDLSRSSLTVANSMFLSTIVFGVALGFLGHWWRSGWIWTSILILMLVIMVMGRSAGPYFRRVRSAAGLVFAEGTWQRMAGEPSADALAGAVASGNATVMTALAIGGWAVILWLMLFKPF